jgi:hypothetical protein
VEETPFASRAPQQKSDSAAPFLRRTQQRWALNPPTHTTEVPAMSHHLDPPISRLGKQTGDTVTVHLDQRLN